MTRKIFQKTLVLAASLALILFQDVPRAVAGEDTGVPITFFGLHVLGYARNGAWPDIPFGAIRLWDTGTIWRDLEPARNRWDFRTLDAFVAKAKKSSIRILMTLGQTPGWAASNPDAESPYGPGASSPPRDLTEWERYVRTLAKRYKGRIHYWEIWNEYDVRHFYSGSLDTLVKMECRAARVLKQVDKQNMILSPSDEGRDYRALKAYLQAGGDRCSDIISYHFYAPRGKPEDMLDRVTRVRALLRRYGQGDKPLWNTETGWLIANSDGGYGSSARPAWTHWRHISGRQAAGWVLRALALMMNEGLGAFYWYAWDSNAMGLAEDHGTRPKEAAEAYRRAVLWFVGSHPQGCRKSEDVWDCSFSKSNTILHLVWSDRANVRYRIPAGGTQVSVSDYQGNSRPIKAGVNSLTVGPVPQLIRMH